MVIRDENDDTNCMWGRFRWPLLDKSGKRLPQRVQAISKGYNIGRIYGSLLPPPQPTSRIEEFFVAQPRNRVGGGSLTREQFLLREMRIVADLRTQGEPDDEIIQRVKRENLFQYGTERMLADRARACLQRLDALENADG